MIYLNRPTISSNRTLPSSGGTSTEMVREMRTRCMLAVRCLLGTNGVRVQLVRHVMSTAAKNSTKELAFDAALHYNHWLIPQPPRIRLLCYTKINVQCVCHICAVLSDAQGAGIKPRALLGQTSAPD